MVVPPYSDHAISMHTHMTTTNIHGLQEPCLHPAPCYTSLLVIFLVLLSATFLNLLKHECYLCCLTHLHSFLSTYMSLALPFSVSLPFLEYSSPIPLSCAYYSSYRTSLLFHLHGLLQILSSIRHTLVSVVYLTC